MSNYNWNDAIYEMNKAASLKSLMAVLYELWENKELKLVFLYVDNRAYGIEQFKNLQAIELFMKNNSVQAIYVQTADATHMLNVKDYQTFRYANNEERKVLTISYTDKQVNLKF